MSNEVRDERINDPRWIREKYHGEGLTQAEIGEITDLSEVSVRYWFKKHGIEAREPGTGNPDAEYRDFEWLHHQYADLKKTLPQIAEEHGWSTSTVYKWLHKHNIEIRGPDNRHPYARLRTSHKGYQQWKDWQDGRNVIVRVSRLTAVAEHGFEAVRDKVVHHKNEITWDDRPENLSILTRAEHAKLHDTLRYERGGGPA